MKSVITAGITTIALQKYNPLRNWVPYARDYPVIVDIAQIAVGGFGLFKLHKITGKGEIGKGILAGICIDGMVDLAERYLPTTGLK